MTDIVDVSSDKIIQQRIEDVTAAYLAGAGMRCQHINDGSALAVNVSLPSHPQVPLVFVCGAPACVRWLCAQFEAAGLDTMPAVCDRCLESLGKGPRSNYTTVRHPSTYFGFPDLASDAPLIVIMYTLCPRCDGAVGGR